ncbi:MAG: hypothetical protein V3T05_02970 [Myxococcota bacterium]
MSARCTVALLIAAALCASCGLFSDKPYLIEGLRVVAIVAEPPEVHPDETSLMTAWIVDLTHPDGPVTATWSYCASRDASQNRARCGAGAVGIDTEEPVTLTDGVFASSAEHGVNRNEIGHVPSLILEAGFWEHVRVSVVSGEEETEALKRVVIVDNAVTPNTNPILSTIFLSRDGVGLEPPFVATAGEEILLVPDYDVNGFESYRVLGADGAWQPRQEEAIFTWHVTGGKLDRWVTEAGDESVRWTLPKTDEAPGGSVHVFAVLRDSRGGTAISMSTIEITD